MWGVVLFITFMTTHSRADTYFNFYTDFLEQGNPGGWTFSHKTFDNEYTVTVGQTSEIDIWVHDVVLDDGLLYAELAIEYNPDEVEISHLEVFDGVNGPPGPWDPEYTAIYDDIPFNPGACEIDAVNPDCIIPDNDDDVIIARIIVKSLIGCDTDLTVINTLNFEPALGSCTWVPYIANPHTITLHQIIADSDADGIPDHEDTCPLHPNSPTLGICMRSGNTCLSDDDCNGGLDVCCMNQACSPACDCKSNFDCDGDVDGTDGSRFKANYGRNQFNNPCTSQDTCNGDLECDGDVDGTDAADFKRYFGVGPLGGYCISCVDGVYQYSCSY